MTALNFGMYIGLAVLAACMIAVAIRIVTARTDADRAVSADLLMFSFTGMLAMIGVLLAGAFFFDLILIASIVGFLSAVSLARALTRGRR
ncbi:MAG: monovalent cation/H+ antiporter complex subunit F [Yaniella sp.]|uniref:monovalent cation/H+ antiporter complex subunit F n=1 Tax=Yaniella sp. TaxID=2773929 RepID=UPI002648B57A|nr:monovalent cation/H+ antiporter complex subunit F [Yaniella sp.]MDN5730730.1 monovalent cation/H+ antiporter complex subunit F [Yaniella sp.]MDN5814755.1 monovalent cation/H+ antiporter complex subunit F [Yaniella sp.]MDN5817473.1 monovalent cation/H+ antiporter complex subunit F [Yaniella sp.]MDN5838427.1 monovalent cation/H+ antiporter complex subunit F [Yaniella sp.]MDN5888732.1 monovalent cation/H+ antiporter complex subunit F [Yaniella sp.]